MAACVSRGILNSLLHQTDLGYESRFRPVIHRLHRPNIGCLKSSLVCVSAAKGSVNVEHSLMSTVWVKYFGMKS